MAIEWGAWEYSGGNGMRVGIDLTVASVSHTSSTVKFTAKIYTENQYSYSDSQTLTFSGAIAGSTTFTNSAGGSAVLRATETHTYTYGANEYGSSPGTRTFTATLSGAFNGVTPSKSLTENIPARPYGVPAAPSSLSHVRDSDAQTTVSWVNNPTSGEPYDSIEVSRWNNVDNGWTVVAASKAATATSHSVGASANRRYNFRLRAKNSEGYSSYAQAEPVQTTPAAPSGAAVVKASATSVTVSWTNNATGVNYDYTTELEQSINGGLWTLVATLDEGVSSTSRTGLSAGSTYQYRVRAKSIVGATTYSGYSTTGTIQLQAPPAAPTLGAQVRNSDTSITLNWTNNGTVDAPYESITVQRWDNVSNAWTTIASLPGTATSVTDTSAVANRKYQYQARANNSAGSSAWAQYALIYTTPDAPTRVEASYTGGTTITVSWVAQASYIERTVQVTPYKSGVAQATVNLSGGETFYEANGIDVLASYYFKVKTTSTVGSLASTETQSNTVMGAAPPNAPISLAPTGTVTDLARATALTWQHSPSQDGSSQKQFQVQHRVSGGAWTLGPAVTSATSSWSLPAGTYLNGQVIEWQVRTWGVHATAGPWSATATLTGSATPTLTLSAPGASLSVSTIKADWNYYDAEATAQTEWALALYNGTGDQLLEERSGADASKSVTLSTTAIDGSSYRLKLRARDGSGLWSDWLEHSFVADFIPPAEVRLSADLDADSGAMVLTLNPTADDGGITTLPATSVTIERQVYDPESEAFGEWETLITNVNPTATVVDTTAPIHGDGHYRVTTFSGAPSSWTPTTYVAPPVIDRKWLYVSGGPNFNVVCRMWANIDISWKASRTKALHYFAGRNRPVLYSGESSEKVLSISGLITDDATKPHQWLRLAQQAGPVLLRAPGNRRIYGALSEVDVERIHNGLHRVSFSIQEVYR